MRIRKILISCLLLIIFTHKAFSQIDTSKVLLNTKLLLTEFLKKNLDRNEIQEYFDCALDFQILTSKGFDSGYLFLKIYVGKNLQNRCNQRFFQLYADSVYVCYSARMNELYKLNGFTNNSFAAFYHDVFTKNREIEKEKGNKQYFIEKYAIEELNLACMYNYYFRNRKCKYIRTITPLFSGVVW